MILAGTAGGTTLQRCQSINKHLSAGATTSRTRNTTCLLPILQCPIARAIKRLCQLPAAGEQADRRAAPRQTDCDAFAHSSTRPKRARVAKAEAAVGKGLQELPLCGVSTAHAARQPPPSQPAPSCSTDTSKVRNCNTGRLANLQACMTMDQYTTLCTVLTVRLGGWCAVHGPSLSESLCYVVETRRPDRRGALRMAMAVMGRSQRYQSAAGRSGGCGRWSFFRAVWT